MAQVESAPVQQVIGAAAPAPPGGVGIRIETLQRGNAQRVKEVALLHYDGFGAKRCCLCFGESQSELQSTLSSAVTWVPDAKLEAYAVALCDEQVVGFAQLGFHDTPGDVLMPICCRSTPDVHTCHLERIVVSQTMRGKGVGTQLLKWVDDKARQRGCQRVKLEVVSNNPAKGLYEKHGYVSHTGKCFKCGICPVAFCLMGHLYFDAMYKPL
eukprot:Skav206057  [mRNA]  locus=scaffold587:359133:361250:+ [translate_table: standard]